MAECEKLRTLAIEHDLEGETRLRRHAACCPTCHDQLENDRELRRLFQGIARPGPSMHFSGMLRERLRAETRLRRRQRRRLLVMRCYWVAAGLASTSIVVSIRWPNELFGSTSAYTIGTVFGMALLVPTILLLSLRVSPMNLFLNTMRAFRR